MRGVKRLDPVLRGKVHDLGRLGLCSPNARTAAAVHRTSTEQREPTGTPQAFQNAVQRATRRAGGGGGSARAGTPHGTYVGWHPYHAETTAVSEDRRKIVSSINKDVFIGQPGVSRADMRSTSKGAWDATDRSCWLRRSPSRAEPFRVQATPSCYGVRNTISVTVFSNVFFPVSASPGVPVTRAPIACACAASAVTCLRLPRGCEGRS